MENIGKFIGGILLIMLTVVFLALPTMWAWNAFMPKVLGLVEISFVDALWLNLLSSMLFKASGTSTK